LTVPSNSSTFGTSITLTATVTPTGAGGAVTFFDGTNILGVGALIGGVATWQTRQLGVGAQLLSAHYDGDSGHSGSQSANLAHAVNAMPAGGFQAAVSYPAGTSTSGLAVADFDGNGALDLAVCDYGGQVNLFLGKSNGTFQVPVITASGGGCALATGDFNGDGKVDLALAGQGGVNILIGNGGRTFQAPSLYAIVGSPEMVAVADFNGDGKADLAVTWEISTAMAASMWRSPITTARPSATGLARRLQRAK
jgi:hypothetical protein